MKIHLRNSYEPALPDSDLTVFVDVFRASTTLCSIMSRPVKKVLGINDYDIIKKHLNEEFILFSEVFNDGYDNSPTIAKTWPPEPAITPGG